MLLARGARVDDANVAGETALLAAARRGHADAVSLLLAAGARIDRANAAGETALHVAGLAGDARSLIALTDRNRAAIDVRDRAGRTPLMAAAEAGKNEAVRILIDAGADRSVRSNRGETAETLAAARGHTAVVSLLGAVR
jgi:ankyrin repeat protein